MNIFFTALHKREIIYSIYRQKLNPYFFCISFFGTILALLTTLELPPIGGNNHGGGMYFYLFDTGGQITVQWGSAEPVLKKQFKSHNNYFESGQDAEHARNAVLTLFLDAQREFYGEPLQLDLFYHNHVLETIYSDFDYYRVSGHYNPEYMDTFYAIGVETGQFCINKLHWQGKGSHVLLHRQGNYFATLEHAGKVLERIEGLLLKFALAETSACGGQMELFAA